MAVCERLQQAGVKPGEIIIWDRNARDLQACGLTINTDPGKIRVFGNDVAGYEADGVACGSAANVKLAKILTRECAMVIESADSQRSRAGGRHLLDEEYVRRRR